MEWRFYWTWRKGFNGLAWRIFWSGIRWCIRKVSWWNWMTTCWQNNWNSWLIIDRERNWWFWAWGVRVQRIWLECKPWILCLNQNYDQVSRSVTLTSKLESCKLELLNPLLKPDKLDRSSNESCSKRLVSVLASPLWFLSRPTEFYFFVKITNEKL